MALFGGKKNCPNCGQPQEKGWDKCPFCAQMGGGMGMGTQGPAMGGGMGAAMGAPGMAPPPGGGFGPPAGFGGGAPSGSTQFSGGGSPYGPPPGGAPPFGGGGFAPPSTAQKTVMFGVGAGPAGALQLLGWLVPLKGPHRGELHTLKPQTVIGKDPTCDIVLNDSFLSSRHATIRAQGGTFVVEDHSTNGTFVNEKKITRQELVDSDILKFGNTLVKFKQL